MLVTKLKDVKTSDYKKIRVIIDEKITVPFNIDKINNNEYIFYYYDTTINKSKSKLFYNDDLVYLMN